MDTSSPDPAGIFDMLDIDLVVKVLSRTVFSASSTIVLVVPFLTSDKGPFFVFFIPIFFYANGAHLDMPLIWGSALYWLAISLFCACPTQRAGLLIDLFTGLIKRGSVLYRNQGGFYAPPRFDWGNQIVLITGGAFSGSISLPPPVDPDARCFWYRGASGKHSGRSQRPRGGS